MVELQLNMIADNKQSISQQLLELSGAEKRIACADAWAFAEAKGLGKEEVGELCNELGIKIYACQLGCF